ncbi:MAG TPA: hypothetical protein VJP80_08220 [Candidatus Saccharimonadales bacterium]|nr:hypothetical protein [Candidatus Saccharimonadales bacterium]
MHLAAPLRRARERGDTIVEVLISVAVVSLILGGAYVVSNNSLQSTRAAQERSNALKLAESQIEQVKGLVANNPNALFSAAAPANFCIDNTGAVIDTTGSNKAKCSMDTTGTPTTRQPVFTIAITRSGQVFTLNETWIDVSGRNNDQLQLIYRVYQ